MQAVGESYIARFLRRRCWKEIGPEGGAAAGSASVACRWLLVGGDHRGQTSRAQSTWLSGGEQCPLKSRRYSAMPVPTPYYMPCDIQASRLASLQPHRRRQAQPRQSVLLTSARHPSWQQHLRPDESGVPYKWRKHDDVHSVGVRLSKYVRRRRHSRRPGHRSQGSALGCCTGYFGANVDRAPQEAPTYLTGM
jgi:hypothetical protein